MPSFHAANIVIHVLSGSLAMAGGLALLALPKGGRAIAPGDGLS